MVRYVAKTRTPAERLRKHRKAAGRDRNTYRGNWIRSIQDAGVQPEMRVMLRVAVKHEDAAERAMIRRMRAEGHPLTNGSLGGDGGALTPELQARASAKLRELHRLGLLTPPKRTPEQTAAMRDRLSILRSNPKHNPMKRPDVVEKNKATNRARHEARGWKPIKRLKRGTPEHRSMLMEQAARIAARPGHSEKISRALKGRTIAATHRDRIAATYADKSGLLLAGKPTSLLAAAKAVGVHPKTVRDRATRRGISVQEALDHYALQPRLSTTTETQR
jgi:hypothetical protein